VSETDDTVARCMPVQIGDLLGRTDDLSPIEFTVYLRLLLQMWARRGTLPNDPDRLSRLARVDRASFDLAWTTIGRLFHAYTVQGEDVISEQRLTLEYEKARARAESIAEKGRKGGIISGGVRKQRPPPEIEAQLRLSLEAERKPSSSPASAELEAQLKPRARTKRDLLRKSGSESGSPSLRSGFLPPFESIIRIFSDLWRANYGKDYLVTPQDRSHLGRLLGTFPSVEAIEAYPWREALTNYLADMDKFVAGSHRHSLVWFCSRGGVNKYQVADRTAGYSDREIRGMQAGAKFDEIMDAMGGLNGRPR